MAQHRLTRYLGTTRGHVYKLKTRYAFTVIMGDSNLSASELRQRYHKGGSLPDSELSAKQIRARHAVPSNSQDFSTKHGQKSGGSATMIVGVVVAVAVVGAIVYFSTK
jgi:hypothetical protein